MRRAPPTISASSCSERLNTAIDVRDSVIVARSENAQRLILLFHGVGADAASLEPLGRVLARRFAPAFVVCVCAPFDADRGRGRLWFSVRDIDDASRVTRAGAAMPLFLEAVRYWQRETDLEPAATTLLGFSQGAIMSLESMQSPQASAGRVIAVAGRLASEPRRAPAIRVNLIHGDQDPVISSALSQRAFEALTALGYTVTLDLIPKLGHVIDERVVERILHRMSA
jgi:phospholipase/carboxylesterase